MILEVAEAIGAAGVGAFLAQLIGRLKTPKPKVCAAFVVPKDRYGEPSAHVRCVALSDPRCTAGHCTFHCRDRERCAGGCLT